jgi:sugar phosphate isomerase/epimerase
MIGCLVNEKRRGQTMHLGCLPDLNLPFPKMVDAVAGIGLKHVQIGSMAFGDLTPAQVRAECRRGGVAVSSMWAGGIYPGMTDAAEIERGLAELEAKLVERI